MKLVAKLLVLGSLCGVYAYAAQQSVGKPFGPHPLCSTYFEDGSHCCGSICTETGCAGKCN